MSMSTYDLTATATREWEHVTCDALFLILDTSAHVNQGTPDVRREVRAHVTECDVCEAYPPRLLSVI